VLALVWRWRGAGRCCVHAVDALIMRLLVVFVQSDIVAGQPAGELDLALMTLTRRPAPPVKSQIENMPSAIANPTPNLVLTPIPRW
jgi:hypothetical protein